MIATSKSLASFASAIALVLCAGSASANATFIVDCAQPTRPSQAVAGAWAGTDNLDAAYHARFRLMAEVKRVCRRQPGAQVALVLQRQPSGRADAIVVAQVTPR